VDVYERLQATLTGMDKEAQGVRLAVQSAHNGLTRNESHRIIKRDVMIAHRRACTLLAMSQDVLSYTIKLKDSLRKGHNECS
jgi:hypothetical protein